MKNSIAKNYIYNLAYQILILLLPLVTTPYLSRVLGSKGIGTYGYTLSIVTYFILFGSLGIAMYGQREIAYVQDDIKKRSRVFWEIIVFRFFTLFISTVIFYFTFASNGDYSIYYKILLIELFSNSLDISWFFQGMEEFKKTVLRNTVIKLISILCIFLFVKTSDDLAIYFIIYVVCNLLGNLSLWLYLPKYVCKINISIVSVFRHFKPTIGLFIPQVAIQIYTVLDKTMIGAILNDMNEVGYYEQSQKIIKMLLTIVTSLGVVMVPRMAHTYAKGDNNKIKEYMKRSFNFVYFLAIPIMFGIISISSSFVPLFFGAGYDKVVILMNVISPIILFIGLSNVIGTQYLLPTKKQKQFTISVTVGAIINCILNFILIRYYYSTGASIATVIAEFCVTLIQFYVVRKEINIIDSIKISRNYVFSGVIMFFACYFVKNLFSNNLIIIFVQAIVGVVIYLSILFILKDEFLISNIKTIYSKLRKKKV